MPEESNRGLDSSADTGLAPVQSRPVSETSRFTPGTLLAGRYRIIAPLGKGGMGEVYRADDIRLGQPVALKFLPAALASDPERLERLVDEVRIGRQISHPNVCRLYDIAYLTAAGEPIEAPGRSPGRGPPYWKSRVLRLQAQGDESEREAWPRATAGTKPARASAQPGLGPRGSVTSGSKNAGCTAGRRSSRAAKVWRVGRPAEAAPGRACERPERADRAPRPGAGARTGWQIALVSLTLRAIARSSPPWPSEA